MIKREDLDKLRRELKYKIEESHALEYDRISSLRRRLELGTKDSTTVPMEQVVRLIVNHLGLEIKWQDNAVLVPKKK